MGQQHQKERRLTRPAKGNGFLTVLEDGVHSLVEEARRALSRPRETPEAKFLREVQDRRSSIRSHATAYIFVNGFLFLVNALTVYDSGVWWFLFPAGAWGIGMGIHAVEHYFWMKDNRRKILAAERVAGLSEFPGVYENRELPSPEDTYTADPVWVELMNRVRQTADQAQTELGRLGKRGNEACKRVKEGLADAERLHAGAERLAQIVERLAPNGSEALEGEIVSIERKQNEARDPRLKSSYASNAELVRALESKVKAIDEDRERMRIAVEGFLFSAQNLLVDAARLSAGDHLFDAFNELDEPTARLADEVSILRTVEDELRRL